jgi:hypothetical protein
MAFVIRFLILLTVGFEFEMAKKSLEIYSKQSPPRNCGEGDGYITKINLYTINKNFGTDKKRLYSTLSKKYTPAKEYTNADTEKLNILEENKYKSPPAGRRGASGNCGVMKLNPW